MHADRQGQTRIMLHVPLLGQSLSRQHDPLVVGRGLHTPAGGTSGEQALAPAHS
jgi:hypothetical protein